MGSLSRWVGSKKATTGRVGWLVTECMEGRADVNQGDLSGTRRVFIAPDKGTKSPPDRSQSVHSSEEAG